MEDLFMEWRKTAATAGQRKATDETVGALFAQALGTVGKDEQDDFGAADLAERADKTLASLAAHSRETRV